MRYAPFSERTRALCIDSVWWTGHPALRSARTAHTEKPAVSPDALTATLLLWLMIGQSIPILITGILWSTWGTSPGKPTWGTSPGKRTLRLSIVDADSHAPMTRR